MVCVTQQPTTNNTRTLAKPHVHGGTQVMGVWGEVVAGRAGAIPHARCRAAENQEEKGYHENTILCR